MKRVGVLLLAIAAGVGVVWASEPGEPLDCSDWVILEPGIICREFANQYAATCPYPFCDKGDGPIVADSAGSLLTVRFVDPAPTQDCPNIGLHGVEIGRFDGTEYHRVAYVHERCSDPVIRKADMIEPVLEPGSTQEVGYLTFDATNGVLYVPLHVYCEEVGEAWCRSGGNYNFRWLAAFEGFATTFEIFQSYDPTANILSFRVPGTPEGMDAADWFDTYWGTLPTVGDWSQAQPLQCAFPAIPPSVGEYLTVADTLPIPDPGSGYYFVTAATYQGETRYGRQASGGELSGRDPAVLPTCE